MITDEKVYELVEPYSVFAKYYHEILFYVEYEAWYDYIDRLIEKHSVNMQRVCDVSCGDGIFVERLLRKGINVFGSDLSGDFINKAKERVQPCERERFQKADMTELSCGEPYTAIFSLHDSVNYLTSKKALEKFFINSARILSPGGFLIFDVSTEYNILEYFDEENYSGELDDGGSFFWNSSYDKKKRLVHSRLDFILPKGEDENMIKRECHKQRIWRNCEIKEAVGRRFEIIGYYESMSFNKPGKTAESEYYVMRKA